MDGTSLTPEQEKLNALRQVLPEAFSEGQLDWEKLKATLGEDINFANERYVLNWAGKSNAFKVLQTPTTKTLIPCPEESVKNDGSSYSKNETFYIENQGNQENQINQGSDNIFIEGENLEVLKVLQKSYFGKVKMIYIDPPYNTGNDSFIYPDKFSESKADYEKRVGDKDEEGYMTKSTQKFPSIGGMPNGRGGYKGQGWSKNSKENGQYHSNWLNMMMPRLYLAKNLLRQDGVIFISIDDNEVHNLRLLMNEIFGEENFVSEIAWRKSDNQANIGQIARVKEYILSFTKSKEDLKLNKIPLTDKAKKEYSYNDEVGNFRRGILLHKTRGRHFYDVTTKNGNILNGPWMIKQDAFIKLDNENKILWTSSGDEQPYGKIYLHESTGQIANDFWDTSFGSNQEASLALEKLFEQRVFDFPKSTKLIKNLITIGSQEESIILDFFAGSGSTAQAVLDLNKEDGGNRKYICVQLPELCEEKSEAYKAGYKTIADISKERIRRAGKKIREEIREEIAKYEIQITKLNGELPTEETLSEIQNLQSKIRNLQSQDTGFKVLKLEDSNFKQWQQFPSAGGVAESRGGKEEQAQALAEQMKLFVDPVSESATVENMVYELLLKSGKDLNAKIFPSFGGVPNGRGGNSLEELPNGRGGRNSKNYFELPFNPKLKERARALRHARNLSEVLFWNQVKNKQFKGFDFDRQKIIGNYIVDFYCGNCNVAIEIDGSSHDNKEEYDAARDAFLASLGLTVIHIPVADVMNNMSGVMEMLFDHPALKGTPPVEGNLNTPASPVEGNLKPDYYVINGNELILLLEKATQGIIDTVIAEKPIKVIALDKLFKGNDQLKTNTVLQMKDAGIEFKTI